MNFKLRELRKYYVNTYTTIFHKIFINKIQGIIKITWAYL